MPHVNSPEGARIFEHGVPEPKIKEGGWRQGKSGQYYEEAKPVFVAKLVIVGGDQALQYKGLNVTYELPYIFAQYPGTMISMLEGTAGERAKLEKFMTLTGFDFVNDEIPWVGNVLPLLEPKQQASDKIFQVRLNEHGFIAKDGLSSVPAYLITPEMLGEADVPAKGKGKTPAKKVPAKKAAGRKAK